MVAQQTMSPQEATPTVKPFRVMDSLPTILSTAMPMTQVATITEEQ